MSKKETAGGETLTYDHVPNSPQSPQPPLTSDSDDVVSVPYKESGPLISRRETADRRSWKQASNAGLLIPRLRHYLRKPLSEFMGTFILIMFGDGVVAQVVLSSGEKGDYQSISWGWVSDHVNTQCLLSS